MRAQAERSPGLSFLCVSLLLATVLAGSAASAQSLASRPVDARPPGGDVVFTLFGSGDEDPWSVARGLARRTGVAFGVETIGRRPEPGDGGPGDRRELILKGRTVGELLDAFAARD